MAPLIRSASLTQFGEVARKVGLDPARLLSEFGLPQGCLTEPDVKLPADAVRQLLETAAERSGVEAFGLLMAESRQLSNLGPAGLLVREQPTVRLALETLARHARKLNEALFITIEDSSDVAVVREELIVGHAGPVRQSTELAIGVVCRMLRTLLGAQWKPLRVCFAHDAPADGSVHARVFGCKVEFGHDFNGVVCARRDLDVPNPNADPGMARYAQKMLEANDAPETTRAATQVRQVVMLTLGSGRCTAGLVAQHMGVDRRTVHRYLAAERETFTGIVDSVRRELAARYIKDRSRTLAEISSLLGFSAPSGFSRWYRRQFSGKASQERLRDATRSA
jgi:AraC-like DNA-binding protein